MAIQLEKQVAAEYALEALKAGRINADEMTLFADHIAMYLKTGTAEIYSVVRERKIQTGKDMQLLDTSRFGTTN